MKLNPILSHDDRLSELEQVVESGLQTFVDVGNALMEIRDKKLYADIGFTTFVGYLESKPWGISDRHAFRVIAAAQVAELTHGSVVNERQARELAPLLASPELIQQIYEEAVEEAGSPEKVTAEQLKAKVQEATPPKPPGRPTQVAEKAKERINIGFFVACNTLVLASGNPKMFEKAMTVATPEEIKWWRDAVAEARAALKKIEQYIVTAEPRPAPLPPIRPIRASTQNRKVGDVLELTEGADGVWK